LALFIALATLLGPSAGFGAVLISTATGGDWNTKTTWTSGKVPAGADDVQIIAGASVSLSASASCHSITFSNNNASATVLTVNTGATLTVSANITCQNAAATNTSVLIQGPGGYITCASVNVGGTTSPTPSSSDFTSTLTCTISNLTVSGSVSVKALYNSVQSAANQGVFAFGSGLVIANSIAFTTVPFFGPTFTLATGSQNGILVLLGSTPFTFTGGGSSTFTPNGTNATVYYYAGAETVAGATYQNLVLANSGTKTTAGVTVNGILSMQGTAKASAAPAYGPSATLEYDGTSAQTNGPELTATIPNLTISNATSVTLTNTSTVTNLLKLATGKFVTGANQINLGADGSVSGGSASSYVNGKVKKTFRAGVQSFTFPIGDNGSYTPLMLSNVLVAVSGDIKASTTAGNHPQIATSGIDSTKAVNRYFTLTQFGGSFGTYDATFNYPAANVDVGATAGQFNASQWSASTWSVATISGTPTTTSTSIEGESGSGDFVIGDPMPLDMVWSGGGGANQNWSNGSNWLGGLPPRAIDDVFFYNNGAVTTASNINNIADSSFGGTVSSITYGNTNNFHTTLINPGVVLTCVSNFSVGTETYVSPTQTVVATITGPGGTLNLNVPGAVWNVRQCVASGTTYTTAPGAPKATLDLSGLGTFSALCLSMDVGVESSSLRRAAGLLYLARTNLIYASGLPAPGTTVGGNPAIYIGHNTQATNQSPSGSAMYLGVTNAIFADYVVTGRGNQTNNLMAFNPAFFTNNPVAYFRGFNGTNRVGLWTIGDNSASGNLNVPSSGTNDFTGGRLDAQVDTMFVGRGAFTNQGTATAPGIGTLTFNNGTINLDTLYIGYQNLGTNYSSSGIGTVNLNSTNATLVVNTNLELAHATNTTLVSPAGTLNINGGTVAANNIVAGKGTSTITATNGVLIVTNTIGTTAAPLTSLAVANSTLQFPAVTTSSNVVTTSLTTGGTTNQINIVTLPAVTSYPTQFTLIHYSGTIGGAGFNFGPGILHLGNPSYLSNDTAKSSIVLVLTAPPTKLAITSVNGGLSPSAGIGFNVVVQAQDNGGIPRIVSTDTTVTLALNAGGGTLGGALMGTIAAGTSSVTISNVTYTKAESGVILTASRAGGDNLTAGNSGSVTVIPGPFAKLQLLMPGETAAPGSSTGKTGAPAAQAVSAAFSVTVNAVDANWNRISTNDTVQISSSDGSATLPLNAALVAGTAAFNVTFGSVGNHTVTASDVTSAGISAGTGSTTRVNPGNQTITFPSPGNQTYGAGPISLVASASSGLPVSYSITSGPATVSGNGLTLTGAGSVTIQASQGGNANWNAATPVGQTISVAKKTLTVTANSTNRTYGATNPVFTVSYSGFVGGDGTNVLSGSPAFSTTATTNSAPGNYPIQISAGTLSAANYTFSFSNGTLTVTSSPSVLTITVAVDQSSGVILGSSGLVPGGTYHVIASTNLVDWAEIGTAQAAPDGTLSFTNAIVFSTQFFRLLGP
jgi:hypothetical protein